MSNIILTNLNSKCGIQPQVTQVVLNPKLLLWADISMNVKNISSANRYKFVKNFDLNNPIANFRGAISKNNKARVARIIGRIVAEKAYGLNKIFPLSYTHYRAHDRQFSINNELIIHGTEKSNYYVGRRKEKGFLGVSAFPCIYIVTRIDKINGQLYCLVDDPLKQEHLTTSELEQLEYQYYELLCKEIIKNKYDIIEIFNEKVNKKEKYAITTYKDFVWGISLEIAKRYNIYGEVTRSNISDVYIGGDGILVSILNY